MCTILYYIHIYIEHKRERDVLVVAHFRLCLCVCYFIAAITVNNTHSERMRVFLVSRDKSADSLFVSLAFASGRPIYIVFLRAIFYFSRRSHLTYKYVPRRAQHITRAFCGPCQTHRYNAYFCDVN